MPPKPKFTREEIIDAAYRVMEERGFEAIAAREVGRVLGTTATPIFTFFPGMEELKTEVCNKARRACADYLKGCLDYRPAFKEFGMRWIRFASEYPNVYAALFVRSADNGFMSNGSDAVSEEFREVIVPLRQEIEKSFDLPQEQAGRLFRDMIMYAQGIATLASSGVMDLSEEVISEMVSRTCISYVCGYQLEQGKLDSRQAEIWLSHLSELPVRVAE